MNRVIKFRAYQPFASLHRQPGMYLVDDMVWHQVTDDQPSAGEVFLTREIGTSRSSEFIEDVQVMQFTGLHDKNGVEIYEGDIINCERIWWDEDGLEFVKEAVTNMGIPQFHSGDWSRDTAEVEVVGNIHENPELLR